MNVDVFISHHTNSSRHIVEAIANKLESIGIRCWHSSRDIVGGDYATSIMQALTTCRIFLLVLNRPASESAHVLNELEIATGRLGKKEDLAIVPFHIADEEIALAAQYYLRRHHWIDAMTPPMYQRVEELARHVAMLLGRESAEPIAAAAEKPACRLVDNLPQARDVFDGRDNLLEEIHRVLSGGQRAVFLEGIGGIGKSELAKQYALRYRDNYDTVQFITYVDSLRKLVCDPAAILIEGFERQPEEKEEDFFRRKLQQLRLLANERTLLIVDNFDVNDDPDLKDFLQGSCKVIFTTRNAHPGYPAVKVGPINDTAALLRIFEQNYGGEVEEWELPALQELLQLIEYHTYTIELIAKQMSASFLTAQDMLDMLQKGQLPDSVSETVSGRSHQRTAFGHICALFNTGSLTDDEKKLLMYLSLMGTKGVPAPRFREWAELQNFEMVNDLIRRSWIRREAGQRISLHPLVKEVVWHELTPTVDNCRPFLEKMRHFAYHAWFRPYKENVAVSSCVLTTLDYFHDLQGREYRYFATMSSFLWQVGLFDDSIRCMHRVYDACVRDLGVNTMDAGFVAQVLGGCYFNSRRERESIRWYKQGLESMIASGAPLNEDLAMSYEKVGRCYTWPYEQDLAEAERLMGISLEMRLEMCARAERGEHVDKMNVFVPWTLDQTRVRLGEIYFEMGRMYQVMGDYQKGDEYSMKHLELIEKYQPQNVSGIAYSHYDCGVCRYHRGKQLLEQGQEAAGRALLEDAARELETALESNMKMRGALAVDTIDNQEVLADTYAALHRYGEASNGYMAVLSMTENLLGKDHPRVQQVKEKMTF